MKTKLILMAYLRSRGKILCLSAALFAIQFLVYGLYRIPFDPAIYAALIMLALLLIVGIHDFSRYRAAASRLQRMKSHAGGILGELPPSKDFIEQGYLETIRALESKYTGMCEQARKDFTAAGQYYILWSHQIKTPIAAMKLLLQEDVLDSKALGRELFKTEQDVEMALQYQRLQMDGNDLLLQEYPLDALVKQAVKRVSPLFIHKKISVVIGEIGCNVLTDEKWLAFVLEQLFSNAVKYTSAGWTSALPGSG